MPSEKCAVSWGSDDDEMRMITASFVCAIERFAGDLCRHFLPLFQQVVAIRKTCSQLSAFDADPFLLHEFIRRRQPDPDGVVAGCAGMGQGLPVLADEVEGLCEGHSCCLRGARS